MARSYLIFGDIEGKLDVLRVERAMPPFRALALFAPPATEPGPLALRLPEAKKPPHKPTLGRLFTGGLDRPLVGSNPTMWGLLPSGFLPVDRRRCRVAAEGVADAEPQGLKIRIAEAVGRGAGRGIATREETTPRRGRATGKRDELAPLQPIEMHPLH